VTGASDGEDALPFTIPFDDADFKRGSRIALSEHYRYSSIRCGHIIAVPAISPTPV
jgi:hypothetical protein